MTSKADIWMPLYIGDYLADTTRLTTEQHGAYLLLIMDYWRNGPIPDDDAVLMQITRMGPDAWGRAQAVLKQMFKQEDGMLKHDRIEREKANAIESNEKKTARAKAGAAAKHEKARLSSAQAVLKQCPSPSPSQVSSEETTVSSAAPPIHPPVDNLPAKDRVWAIAFPMLMATGIAEARARSVIGQLLRRCGDEAVLQAALEAERHKPVEPISWLQATAKAIATKHQPPPGGAKPSRHLGIDRQDFTEGVTRDGRF